MSKQHRDKNRRAIKSDVTLQGTRPHFHSNSIITLYQQRLHNYFMCRVWMNKKEQKQLLKKTVVTEKLRDTACHTQPTKILNFKIEPFNFPIQSNHSC